jgi:CNT family concentrative nucleoside transporter
MLESILRGLLGVVVLLGLCVAFSSSRRSIDWRLVLGGMLLQAMLAFLVLLTPFGSVVDLVSGWFVKLLAFTDAGSAFLFGDLLDASKYGFAFKVLPTIIFVSALTSALYYLGVLQWVVFSFAWLMKRAMRLSGAESLAAAANVFVGQTEAPLVVKPYVARMTRSEIMSLMTGGMATIAGSVFGLYIVTLAGEDPAARLEVARRLLTASIMNAPAALLVAKMLVPETRPVSEDLFVPRDHHGSNLLDALANGTSEGIKLALNVAAMLLVFVALIAMVNAGFAWVGGLGAVGDGPGALDGWVRGISAGAFEGLSLEALVGFVFAPIAWVVGGESGDLLQLGQLFGTKMVTNEFIAYTQLAELQANGGLGDRSIFLATFALCGFANFSSIGIQLGGIGAMAPEQRPTLAALGFKAMFAGTIASLLTASIAGMFFGVVR